MKTFRQTIQEISANDKLDKLGHKPLSVSHLKQLATEYPTFEDIDLDQWQGSPPPSNSSQVTKNEIHNLISLGQNHDQWERDMVMHDKTIMQAFREYLDEHGLEVDLARIKKIKNESYPILLSLKRYYNRPRPQVLAKKIGLDLSFFSLKTAETPSYPSGHATQGRLVAKLIADEVPLEHRRNILDIGERVGYSRQIAGAHYASDTEFGHRLGDELYRLASTRQEPDLKLEDVLSELEVANKAALAKYIGDLKTGKMRASTTVKYTDSGETSTVGKEMPDAATDDDDEKDKKEPESKSKHSLKTDKERNKKLSEVADLFIAPDTEKAKGSGRFTMSKKDVTDYKDYLKLTPEKRQVKLDKIKNKQREKIGEVTTEDIGNTKKDLRDKLGTKKYNALVASIKKKGDPPGEYSKGDRGKERLDAVIKHYLETGGVSPITGEVVPFHDSQLDHITSLDNGGKDGPENWMWMESRMNQFKGSLTDPEVEGKLIERGLMTVNELDKETKEDELKNWKDASVIAYWETKFESGNPSNLSHEKLDNMTADQLKNFVKGWNNHVGEDDPRFVARYGSRKVKVSGSEKPLEISRGGDVKPDKNNPESWGVQKDKDGNLTKPEFKKNKDGYEKALARFDKSRKSGGKKITKEEVLENIKHHLSSDKTPFGHPIPDASDEKEIDEAFEAIQKEKVVRKNEISRLNDIIKKNPKASSNIKKEISKILKTEPDPQKRTDLAIQLWKDFEKKFTNREERMSFKQWNS
jgi:hypothetical protein